MLCQAKSGMGKTAVFVLACLQQLDGVADAEQVQVVVLCHTRELAFQIKNEFTRFCKFLDVKTAVFYGTLFRHGLGDCLEDHTASQIL